MALPRLPSLVLLLVLLAGLPWLAYRSHRSGQLIQIPRTAIYLSSVLSQWLLFAALALVLWLEGSTFARVGLDRRLGLAPVMGWGLATTAAAILLTAIARAIRLHGGQPESAGVAHVLPRSVRERALFVALVSPTAGFVEESLYRGFAIPCLAALLGSTALALLVSTAAFAAGHAFQGRIGLLRVAALGALLALPYLVTGSLWPSVLAHATFDAVGGTLLARWLMAEARS